VCVCVCVRARAAQPIRELFKEKCYLTRKFIGHVCVCMCVCVCVCPLGEGARQTRGHVCHDSFTCDM